MLCGSLTATIFAKVLSQAALESWGWRIPFLLGLVIAFVGFYIRHHTEESPHYDNAKESGNLSETPIRDAFNTDLPILLRAIGIYLSVTVPFYTLTVFINGFMSGTLKLPLADTYFINTCSMIMLIVMLPITAHLSDLYGRKRLLLITAFAYLISIYSIFSLMKKADFDSVITAVLIFTFIVSFYIGAVPALLVELFPTRTRYTSMALSYNFAAILGGMTPVIETKLLEVGLSPAVFIMVCAVISIIAFIGYKDIYDKELS